MFKSRCLARIAPIVLIAGVMSSAGIGRRKIHPGAVDHLDRQLRPLRLHPPMFTAKTGIQGQRGHGGHRQAIRTHRTVMVTCSWYARLPKRKFVAEGWGVERST